ncbi:MAG: SRPBCC family protein [Myxococcaceae bacterium]|nr:SRPBCC family protein [Myxococcaceae bacterium]
MMLTALAMMVVLADPPANDGWEVAAQEDNLTVYARERKDTSVREMKAVGVIDAPPEKVWKALRDYENYSKTMPYTQVSKIVAREGGDKVIWFYSVVNTPIVARRDYCIKLTDVSKWDNGKGYLKVVWTASNDKAPPKPDDVVRVTVNDGYWLLEPVDGGKKTKATYYVFTDPGGSLPKWLVNKANSSAVPDVFEATRKAALK